MFTIKNKVALITGGAEGLGNAIARVFAAQGARVVITDIQESLGKDQASAIGCDFIKQDVTNEEQWKRVIRDVEEKYGVLHILVSARP